MFKLKPLQTLSDKDEKRLWANISVTSGTDDCWEWKRSVNMHGYGMMRIRGIKTLVHRLAYLCGKNQNPYQLLVLHTCDNRRCCNPNHLFLGTPQDNSTDCVKKGRIATGQRVGCHTKPESRACGLRNGNYTHPERISRGSKHPVSKITEADAVSIIAQYSKGVLTMAKLGEKFGISGTGVRDILVGRTWKHVRQDLSQKQSI